MTTNESISLVLGSGGARGHAHIGVIRAIEEAGIEIRNIAGTSMGAVVGGVFAADELQTYSEWAYKLEKNDVVHLLDFSFDWQSIFKGERIFDVLKELIGDREIEELDRGFTAVATALNEQREVWLNSGSLFDAIRASTAVPGVFSPVERDGMTLVDGGLVNPIPIAPTLRDSTSMTIAVNLAGMKDARRKTKQVKTEKRSDSDDSYRKAITDFVASLVTSDSLSPSKPGAADILVRSVDVMQGSIARLKLAAYAPDLVIDIPRDACSFFEFHRAEEMAELGYKLTQQALRSVERLPSN